VTDRKLRDPDDLALRVVRIVDATTVVLSIMALTRRTARLAVAKRAFVEIAALVDQYTIKDTAS
jgi:hypothetical protein